MDESGAWTARVGLGRLYGLAGDLFRDTFAPHREPGWPSAWRECVGLSGREAALSEVSAALVRAFEEARERRADAEAERSRLLLLGGCPAYETTYMDAFARPRELADVSGFYKAFGLRTEGERADHLSVECEFAALLCVKEAIAVASGDAEAAGRCRDARASFLRDHLGTWLALYEEDLGSQARLPLLGAAVAALRAVVAAEAGEMGVQIVERTRPRSEPVPAAPSCDPAPAGPA